MRKSKFNKSQSKALILLAIFGISVIFSFTANPTGNLAESLNQEEPQLPEYNLLTNPNKAQEILAEDYAPSLLPQTFVYEIGEPAIIEFVDICEDDEGFLYTIGSQTVSELIEMIPIPNTDFIIAKWDKNGTNIWAESWGFSGSSFSLLPIPQWKYATNDSGIAIDYYNGAVYAIGTTNQTGSKDVSIVAWDATTGGINWNTTYDVGSGSEDIPTSIIHDEAGNLFIGGNNEDTDEAFILKWSSIGGTTPIDSVAFNLDGSSNERVNALIYSRESLYSAGTYVSGGNHPRIQRWNTDLVPEAERYDGPHNGEGFIDFVQVVNYTFYGLTPSGDIIQVDHDLTTDIEFPSLQDGNYYHIDKDINGDLYITGSLNNVGFLGKFPTHPEQYFDTWVKPWMGTVKGLNVGEEGFVYTVGMTILSSELLESFSNITFTTLTLASFLKWPYCYAQKEETPVGNDFLTNGMADDQDIGCGQTLVTDQEGNSYAVGRTKSYGAGNWDAYITKYDVDGNQLWQKTWGGTNSDGARAIALSPDGTGIYITGYTRSYSTTGNDSAFVIKLNANGNQIWQWISDNPTIDDAFGITINSDGSEVYLSGYDYLGMNSSKRLTMQMLYANGSFGWIHYYDSENQEQGWSVQYNSETNTLVQLGTVFNVSYKSLVIIWDANGTIILDQPITYDALPVPILDELQTFLDEMGYGNEFNLYEAYRSGFLISEDINVVMQNIIIDSISTQIFLSGYILELETGASVSIIMCLNYTAGIKWTQAYAPIHQEYSRGYGMAVQGDYLYQVGYSETGIQPINSFLIKYDKGGNYIYTEIADFAGESRGKAITIYGTQINVWGYAIENGNEDLFFMRYRLSAKFYNTSSSWIDAGDKLMPSTSLIKVGLDGNVYSAFPDDVSGNQDIIITKWDYFGNNLWNLTWGGDNDEYPYAIAEDPEDYSIIVVGVTKSFDGGLGHVGALLKINQTTGQIIWNSTWDNGNACEIYSIVFSKTEEARFYFAAIDENNDITLVKYNSTAPNEIWNTQKTEFEYSNAILQISENDTIFLLSQDSAHDAIITSWHSNGTLRDTSIYMEDRFFFTAFTLDDDTNSLFVSGGSNIYDFEDQNYFVSKLDYNGNEIWHQIWDVQNYFEVLTSIDVYEDNIYVCGMTTKFKKGIQSTIYKLTLDGEMIQHSTYDTIFDDAFFSLDVGYDGTMYIINNVQDFSGKYDVVLTIFRDEETTINPYDPHITVLTPSNNSFVVGNQGNVPFLVEIDPGINAHMEQTTLMDIGEGWFEMSDLSDGYFTTCAYFEDFASHHGDTYQYYFNTTNHFNRNSTIVELSFTVDNVDPILDSYNLDGLTYLTADTLLEVEAHDDLGGIDRIELNIQEIYDDQTKYPTVLMNFNASADIFEYHWKLKSGLWTQGSYSLEYVIFDRAGNSITQTKTVILDYQTPSIAAISHSNHSLIAGEIQLEYYIADSSSGLASTQIKVGEGSYQAFPNSANNHFYYDLDTTAYSEGLLNIWIQANDNSGQTLSYQYHYTIDNTNPQGELSDVENDQGEPLTLHGVSEHLLSVSDGNDLIRIAWRIDNSPYIDLELVDTQSLEIITTRYQDGSHEIYVLLVDSALNQQVLNYTILIDNEAPQLSVWAIDEGQTIYSNQILEIQIFDKVGANISVYYLIDGQECSGTETCNWQELEWNESRQRYVLDMSTLEISEGAHYLTIRAMDSAGNTDIDEYLFVFQSSDHGLASWQIFLIIFAIGLVIGGVGYVLHKKGHLAPLVAKIGDILQTHKKTSEMKNLTKSDIHRDPKTPELAQDPLEERSSPQSTNRPESSSPTSAFPQELSKEKTLSDEESTANVKKVQEREKMSKKDDLNEIKEQQTKKNEVVIEKVGESEPVQDTSTQKKKTTPTRIVSKETTKNSRKTTKTSQKKSQTSKKTTTKKTSRKKTTKTSKSTTKSSAPK